MGFVSWALVVYGLNQKKKRLFMLVVGPLHPIILPGNGIVLVTSIITFSFSFFNNVLIGLLCNIN